MGKNDSEPLYTRRSFVRGAGALGGLAALGLTFGNRPALAAETGTAIEPDGS